MSRREAGGKGTLLKASYQPRLKVLEEDDMEGARRFLPTSWIRRWTASAGLAVILLPLSAVTNAPTPVAAANGFCARLGQSLAASSGAQMFCDAQSGSPAAKARLKAAANQANAREMGQQPAQRRFGNNVDAGNPQEDQYPLPPSAQVYGQAETSIAATGPYVVEAWNDATGFFAPCGLPYSPPFKEELTGYGFSSDGGRTFTDMGGLPNDCTTGFTLYGDPSVETWQVGGVAYFYISSLYLNFNTGESDLALNTCHAAGATLTCSYPQILATGSPGDFLDKEYLSIDPAHGRLDTSFTRFGAPNNQATAFGQIEVAVCDIATNPAAPICFPGASPTPYLIVQPGDANCENEGVYPAANVKSGDLYVAWEFNWATNEPQFFTPACIAVPVENRLAYIPSTCLTFTPVSPCGVPTTRQRMDVVSIDAAHIPGYNRIPSITSAPPNDFPRIAVSVPAGTVSVTWNDARRIPTADILLRSFSLVTLTPVQPDPVRINADPGYNWNVLPGLRNATADGRINISWYQQHEPGALTDVVAALHIDPRTDETPSNARITTSPTGWLNVSTNIQPNFGDYTDNYVIATANAPYTDESLFVAWSDGRMGLPQPFAARVGPEGQSENGQ